MKFYVVHYVHLDDQGWQRYKDDHVTWLKAAVSSGSLRASGPVVNTPSHTAFLIFGANSSEELTNLLRTDPYYIHGLVSEMQLLQWEPVFGVFSDDIKVAS